MVKTNSVVKSNMLKMTLQFDETATFETKVGILEVQGAKMTSTLYILRTGLSQRIMVTISDVVTYSFDNEGELQKFLSKKKFKEFESEKAMWQSFTGMDDETWEEWNK